MNIRDLRNLCEAYTEIYEDNDFEFWVNSLIEEGYDLSDYTWEEMYEEYLNEMGQVRTTGQRSGVWRPTTTPGGGSLTGMGGGRGSGRSPGGIRGGAPTPAPTTRPPAPKPPGGGAPTTTPPAPTTAPRPSGGGAPTPTTRPPAPRPSSAPATARPTPSAPVGGAKVSPSAAAPSGGQTGDKAKDMATWAKANPTLANRPRTPNPLMQRTFGYQTGQGPRDQKGITSQTGSTAKSQSSIKKEGVMWGDASKIVDDIANAYQSVYEAKKIDQDQDGDNDFADIRIARMIASGVPKEVAIAKVKGKPYNEEYELDEASPTNPRLYRGRHGQTETEYQRGRSPAGKRISGDEKEGPASYASRWASKAEPTRPGEKPKNTPRLSKGEKTYAKYEAGENKRLRPLKRVGGEKGLPEDFSLWIDELLDEGYDLSDYTWDEMYEIYEETDEERRRNERRARIAELQASGRVMTSSKRASQRAKQRREEQRAEKLEKLANAAIEATRGTTRRSSAPMGAQEPEEKPEAPTANRRLPSTVKNDRLASRADELLRMLQKEDFVLWIDELLDEGYELENWTDEELYDLYEEIIEEKYGTAAGRKRVAKMARAGKDIGKKGPGFEAMVTKLTPKYGKKRATKIAAAQMWKTHA